MAKISEQQAKKILEENGYEVLDYLGEGSASHAFKASRISKKTGAEKIVAAKVCCPQITSRTSLDNELKVAAELKEMKDKFKSSIAEAQRNGQTELVKKFQDASKYVFKYLNVPKLKLQMKKSDSDGKDYEIAIFEAPLADSSIVGFKIGGGTDNATVTIVPDPRAPGYNMRVISGIDIDYKELKRTIKSVLKGLKAIHEQGMVHQDIAFRNILKKFDSNKNKYRYSITDFGTLKKGDPSRDLHDASCMFLGMWLISVGMDMSYVYRMGDTSIEYYLSSEFKNEGVTGVKIPEKFGGKPKKCFLTVYYPTDKDMELVNFCKKLYNGDFKSAEEALADPWLKKQ